MATDVAGSTGEYHFAISTERLAVALRKLAEDVEAGKIIPQRFITAQMGEQRDFLLHRLIFTYAQKKESPQ